MADKLEFKLIDPVEANENWALEYGSKCKGVEIYINGTEIVPILKGIEILYASKEGKPHLAGDYGHNTPKHLYSQLTKSLDGAELLCCGGCGDSGCWSVLVSIEQDDEYVYWNHFEHNHRDWEYGLSYRFEKQEYEQAMQQLKGFVEE